VFHHHQEGVQHCLLFSHASLNYYEFVDFLFQPKIKFSLYWIEHLIVYHAVSAQVVSSVKWLEDELELNALHNPGSRQGSGNEKAALSQRSALSAALGGRVDVTAMTTISGGLHLLYNSLV